MSNGDGFDDIQYGTWIALGPVYGDITGPDIITVASEAAGDFNGDGYDDAMENSWAPPVVSFFLAPFEERVSFDMAVATIAVRGDANDYIEVLSSIGDQNGDALPDVGFNFSDEESGLHDRLYLFSAPFEGAHTVADAWVDLRCSTERLELTDLIGPGDFQGDGSANDFLVGDGGHSSYRESAGIGWVMVGGSFP